MKRVLVIFICTLLFLSALAVSPAVAAASAGNTAAKVQSPKPSKYAELSDIKATYGSWNRAYSTRYRTYTLTLDEKQDSTTITPAALGPGTAVYINGTIAADITVKIDNGKYQYVRIKTVLPDMKSRTYTIKVIRKKCSNNDLASISSSYGKLDADFDPAKLEYALNLDWYMPSLMVSAAKLDPHATLRIDGRRATSRAYTISPDTPRTVNISVRSQSGSTKTYILHITRAPSPFTNKVEALIDFAKHYMGKPYVSGGKGPDCFDCSGFVYFCLKGNGVPISYMTSHVWPKSIYQTIPTLAEMIPGDILCFNGHVGIYLGDNKMIDCVTSAGGVRITSCNTNYWTTNYICGKRVFTNP